MRVAVLIDCDNVGASWAPAILTEAARHGTPTIKRAYGDFTDHRLGSWRDLMAPLAIQPILQLPNTVRKNATDSALIIDAMDLLHGGGTDVFCLVSSDSDFTRLATRLRESGKEVVGIGASHTPESFRNACDVFTFLEVLAPRTSSGPDTEVPDIDPLLLQALDATARDDGWADLAAFGNYLRNAHPAFDPRLYGHAKLGELVRSRGTLEVAEVATAGGGTALRVRRGR